jgi:hypothetical protein
MGFLPMDQNDLKLIEAIATKAAKEEVADQRDLLVQGAVNKILADPAFDKLRMDIKEGIETSVEASLKRRYMWLGIIMAALVGGGAAGIFNAYLAAISKDAITKVIQSEMLLEQNNGKILEEQNKLDEARKQADAISKQFEEQKRVYQTQNEVLNSNLARQQFAASIMEQSLAALEDVRAKLAAKGIETVPTQTVKDLNEKASQLKSQIDLGRFRVFLHVSQGAIEEPYFSKIQSAIRAAGFVLVSTERDNDLGGTRVDYFNVRDCVGARTVASLIDDNLPRGSQKVLLKPHEAINPPGWLGVWLSSKSPLPPPAGAQECS